MNREEAWKLLNEFTKSDSLLKHALAVEAAMRHYAARFNENADWWGVIGLIHDFDYERWPNAPEHTTEGARVLRERGVDEEIVGAMLSHATWQRDQYPLDRPVRKTLSAVDELCGFITAVAYARQNGVKLMAGRFLGWQDWTSFTVKSLMLVPRWRLARMSMEAGSSSIIKCSAPNAEWV